MRQIPIKDIDVSDDHIFLQQLTERHNINAKQLAGWTGRAASTVYKYMAGNLPIPTIVWRTIFERTLDASIIKLVTGELPCIFAPIGNVTAAPDAATIKNLLSMRDKQLSVEKYILHILSDGVVDQSDESAIANYKLAFPDMIAAQTQIYQAIQHAYKKSKANHV